MKIVFWGVRGSVPCPGADTVRYGGNTPCIELCLEDSKRHIIIDSGTGIRDLGHNLMHRCGNGSSRSLEIFITHTHWDHIQGFPFFSPLYDGKMSIKIYGPATDEHETLMNALGGQLSYRYFPIRENALSAEIEYTELKEGCLDLGDGVILTTKYLNHPLRCLGYRFAYRGKTVCTAYDREPFQNLFKMDPDDPDYDETMVNEGQTAVDEQNRGVDAFLSGADVLIQDGQYTEAEYQSSKVGWGHTSVERAIADGRQSGVKRLVLFHHEPLRTDDQLDRMAERYCGQDDADGTAVCFAQEGMEIEV